MADGVDASEVTGAPLAPLRNGDLKLWLVDNLIWVLLVGSVIAFGLLHGRSYFNVSNLRFIIYSTAMLGFLVMAEGICLLSGNFDLSVGQAAGFAGMVNAVLLTQWAPGLPWWVGVVTVLLIGVAIGAFNGFFVGYLGLNPFLLTLGTYLILRYGTLEVNLQTIREGFPPGYLTIGGGGVFDIPYAIFIMIVGGAVLHVVLRHTRFGSDIYAIGGNADAAGRVGIDIEWTTFRVFVVAGVLSAISGLLFTGFLGSATPGMADGTLFMAFAGAVIGGASLTGGRGSILNMLGGALLLGVLQAGLGQAGVGGNITNILFGVLVVVAIIVNRVRDEVRDGLLMPG